MKRCRIRSCGKATDLELAEQASAGDASAFRTIMQRHNGRLYREARSVLENDSDAEDAVQNAYLKPYARLGEFRGGSALSTWLTRIVLNEALMRVRVADLHLSVQGRPVRTDDRDHPRAGSD